VPYHERFKDEISNSIILTKSQLKQSFIPYLLYVKRKNPLAAINPKSRNNQSTD